ncbi:MAG: Aspartyl/Asparaginyl beta-hydroxylase [Sphingomonas bacterium]|uniref:aspartyl/asparaginyl beta-hydroxylase domain-containing protein n=1 Tax=Sphingomonas bacterium TaxID=1895847 RepID=UPI002628670C|nr:aspartyl/asparaginyl beta-hydroxylase domain-containing protein [Sphingomonas bacterium]MDB5694677.1 Aspartyl/Asparaginyl beta-hydroxylase [Sphingomonas bacterium]
MTRLDAQESMAFADRVRLPLLFDAAAMAADLARLEALAWTDHFVRQNYSGVWSVVPLRAPAGETHPIRMIAPQPAATSWVDTPLLDHAPACRAAIETFRCPVTVARLMRLTPGSRIHEHSDPDLAAEAGMARIHVVVTTNPDVEFLVNGRAVTMLPGECWYLRLSDPHAVFNGGSTDRVHLVLDLMVDEWLTAVIARGEAE